MKKILTKVAKGIAFGDVSNTSIRNILTEISRKIYGNFTEQDMIDTLNYFEWKCPYTGKDLRHAIENGIKVYVTDHIYPQNKEYCGLNVKGNLVIVDKDANARKSNKSIKDFMLDRGNDDILGASMQERENRLKKIELFQKLCGYNPEKIRNELSPVLVSIYNDIRNKQEDYIKQSIEVVANSIDKNALQNPKKSSEKHYKNKVNSSNGEAKFYSDDKKLEVAFFFISNNESYQYIDKNILKCETDRHGGTTFNILKKLGVTNDKKNILSFHSIDDEIATSQGIYKDTLIKIKNTFNI